jgi:TRAP-type C4-dicarboxylate transport system permease small subunit
MTGDSKRPEDHPIVVEDGVIHLDARAEEAALDLSDVQWDDAPAFLLFWALAGVVFTQFFTRYVLNDSAAWTEEIARYLLIGTVFIGASIGVAKNNHIQVDFLYRYLPAGPGRWLARVVDVLRIVFFAAMTVYTVQLMQKMGNYQMTIIDLPMNIVYGVVLFGFAAMAVRSLWVAKVHWQRGYSVLERPESDMDDR